MTQYPKRLIEVDLPIKRISAHARREKSIRHGHISTLHIWWARRPLAACRAVICASLWPDPADELCPQAFCDAARSEMRKWTENRRLKLLGEESQRHFDRYQKEPTLLDSDEEVRRALLDFIADFANWDNSTNAEFLATSRTLTQVAHDALGGTPGTRPLVVDPFAGGGAIPLEALRVGADTFASDLNPVAVLLNKVVLEYIPKYGQQLADEVQKWGEWIKDEASKELAKFYPIDSDGSVPIAYLWARTVNCEGPGCGAEIPLLRSRWLVKKGKKSVGLKIVPDSSKRYVNFEIVQNAKGTEFYTGTVARGAATCPCCGYTIPVERVRSQLRERNGGADDARLYAVVTLNSERAGRSYRVPTQKDIDVVRDAVDHLKRQKKQTINGFDVIPDEDISLNEIRRITVPIYGMTKWSHLFLPRQLLVLTQLSILVNRLDEKISSQYDQGLATAIQTCLALVVDRQVNTLTSLSRWNTAGEKIEGLFARQAIPMVWDFAEANMFSGATGDFDGALKWVVQVCSNNLVLKQAGQAEQAMATAQLLADDSVQMLLTDPPYYDAVPYAHLSDFFYVWLRRMLYHRYPQLFEPEQVIKDPEIVVDRPHELSTSTKDINFYESELLKAFSDSRRVVQPSGIGSVVFASKTTSSWEAILNAVVEAGWIVTGSWPIDTEMVARIAAQGQARLASSIHLVCRPREHKDGTLQSDEIGDWRSVLQELPQRIHAWLPRLANEGVVGADAIFACLGPALEIFSRYSRVEKASGEVVTLGEYLEQVWAAVSKEALAMVFQGADTTGFEEDARLTAMWLWTLGAGSGTDAGGQSNDENESDDDEPTPRSNGKKSSGGYTLEYDAARKIAQGLGAHLEQLPHLIEVKGSNARLLPVDERTKHLFGQASVRMESTRKARAAQPSLFAELPEAEAEGWTLSEEMSIQAGQSALDRVHQSMLLFAAGRSEALKRFLVDDGVGNDERFWRLGQALSALYPVSSNEKRWVDGVLARKKGLGFA